MILNRFLIAVGFKNGSTENNAMINKGKLNTIYGENRRCEEGDVFALLYNVSK